MNVTSDLFIEADVATQRGGEGKGLSATQLVIVGCLYRSGLIQSQYKKAFVSTQLLSKVTPFSQYLVG